MQAKGFADKSILRNRVDALESENTFLRRVVECKMKMMPEIIAGPLLPVGQFFGGSFTPTNHFAGVHVTHPGNNQSCGYRSVAFGMLHSAVMRTDGVEICLGFKSKIKRALVKLNAEQPTDINKVQILEFAMGLIDICTYNIQSSTSSAVVNERFLETIFNTNAGAAFADAVRIATAIHCQDYLVVYGERYAGLSTDRIMIGCLDESIMPVLVDLFHILIAGYTVDGDLISDKIQ